MRTSYLKGSKTRSCMCRTVRHSSGSRSERFFASPVQIIPSSLSLHSEIRGRGDRRKRYDIGMLISPDWEGGFRIQTDRQTHSARRAQAAPNLPLKNARPDRQNGEISYQPINWNSKAHDTHNLSSGVVLSKTATPFDDLFIKLPKLFKLKLKAQIW